MVGETQLSGALRYEYPTISLSSRNENLVEQEAFIRKNLPQTGMPCTLVPINPIIMDKSKKELSPGESTGAKISKNVIEGTLFKMDVTGYELYKKDPELKPESYKDLANDYKKAYNDFAKLKRGTGIGGGAGVDKLIECEAYGTEIKKTYENVLKYEEKIKDGLEDAIGKTGEDRRKADRIVDKNKQLYVNETVKLLSEVKDYALVKSGDVHAYVSESDSRIVENLADIYVISPKGTVRRAYGTDHYETAKAINCDFITIKTGKIAKPEEGWVNAVSKIGTTHEVDPVDLSEGFEGKLKISADALVKIERAKDDKNEQVEVTFLKTQGVRVVDYDTKSGEYVVEIVK